jgi:peptidoglycan hydrolase-like protein with peptidoglycan-binding domain
MVYTVQPGDTLFRIARKFGVTVAEIVAANNIKDPNRINVGQRLIIPVPAQKPTIRRGSRGPAVRVLQESLITLGYNPGPVDGIFGLRTEAAVKAFQADRKIKVDGIVGPVTWGEIAKALAEERPPVTPPPVTPPPTGIPGEPADLPAPEPTTDIPGYNLVVEMVPMGPAPDDASGGALVNTTTGEINVSALAMPAPSTFGPYTTYFAYLEVPGQRVVGELELIPDTTEDYTVDATITTPINETRVTVRPANAAGTVVGPAVLVGRLV